MNTIANKTLDQERALYGLRDTLVKDCIFDGPADGESAFKECADVEADHPLLLQPAVPLLARRAFDHPQLGDDGAVPGGFVVFPPH